MAVNSGLKPVQRFADGGVTANTTQTPTVSGGIDQAASVGGNSNVYGKMYTAAAPMAQKAVGGIGGMVQGINAAFTPQSGYQAGLAPTAMYDYSSEIGGGGQAALNNINQFNTNLSDQQSLLQALNPQGIQGINAQTQLSNQLLDQTQGGGPSVASTQLASTTGANVANQAALMAGQRGTGANAGLLAREIAQQGASTQQNAAGQAAVLRAQEIINARQQLAGLSNNQISQQTGLQGQIGQQITGAENANTNLFGTAAGANTAQNNTSVANYGMAQGINADTANKNAAALQKGMGGLMNGAGSALAALAEGGEVPVKKMADGGASSPLGLQTSIPDTATPSSNSTPPASSGLKALGAGMQGYGQVVGGIQPKAATSQPATQPNGPQSSVGKFFQGMGNTTASANEISKASATGYAKGGPIIGEYYAAKGKEVPGKAKVKGDSLKNDTVPALLSPGEIILPREVAQSPNAAQESAKFVAAVKAKKRRGLG